MDKMAIDLVGILVQIVVATVILAPVLWIAGRLIAGKDKAKFTDALWIVLLGTVIGAVVGALVGNLVATIVMFVIWLALIKHFFDCGWLKALLIAIVAVVIFAVIIAILAIIIAIIGIGIIAPWF
jgi:hypothetical protein